MPRFSFTHQPRYGELFNDKTRGPWRSNGKIVNVDWSDNQIHVAFWTQSDAMEYASYDFEQVEGYWTDSFGGTYVMPEPIARGVIDDSGWLSIFLTKIWLERRGGYLE